MRRVFFAILLAGSLLASPALAKGPALPLHQEIGRDFATGAHFYVVTIKSWFDDLLSLIGLKKGTTLIGEGSDCSGDSVCSPGLACLNTCTTEDCLRYAKRCVKGDSRVTVLGEYSPCDETNLCAAGTDCTHVCQKGFDCGGETNRCMKPVAPAGSCRADNDCVSVCGAQPFPPIGPSAYEAHCVQDACWCYPIAIKPELNRTACPNADGAELSCPGGTQIACTTGTCTGENCPVVKTCLTQPEYGGQCLADQECNAASCVAGAAAFCGTDNRCKCRVTQQETISCNTADECSGSACTSNEIPACIQGSCACAPAAVTTVCQTVNDCSSDCPQGYKPACDKNACVCQRTTVVSVSCKTVDDCGSVSCPSGYEKSCRNDVCTCGRTPQP